MQINVNTVPPGQTEVYYKIANHVVEKQMKANSYKNSLYSNIQTHPWRGI